MQSFTIICEEIKGGENEKREVEKSSVSIGGSAHTDRSIWGGSALPAKAEREEM